MSKFFEKREFNQSQQEASMASKLEFLAQNLPATLRVGYSTSSFVNGASFYFQISKQEGKFVNLRVSDHANGEGFGVHFGELSTSVNTSALNAGTINEIRFAFGELTREFRGVDFKTFEIEVMEVKEGQVVISQRTTKNGNTLYTIAITKATKQEVVYTEL
jgi:hypothetical protein